MVPELILIFDNDFLSDKWFGRATPRALSGGHWLAAFPQSEWDDGWGTVEHRLHELGSELQQRGVDRAWDHVLVLVHDAVTGLCGGGRMQCRHRKLEGGRPAHHAAGGPPLQCWSFHHEITSPIWRVFAEYKPEDTATTTAERARRLESDATFVPKLRAALEETQQIELTEAASVMIHRVNRILLPYKVSLEIATERSTLPPDPPSLEGPRAALAAFEALLGTAQPAPHPDVGARLDNVRKRLVGLPAAGSFADWFFDLQTAMDALRDSVAS
jgi:hypothetical protein